MGIFTSFFSKEEKPVVSVCTKTRAPNESFSSKAALITSMTATDTESLNIPVTSKPLQSPEHSLGST